MGKTILTAKQLDFLELAQIQPSITKNFYFTGGTALSEFYLKHRLSEDIDLFSEKEVNVPQIEAFLKGISPKIGVDKIIKENFLGLYTYKLKYKDGEELKVDFSYYPFPQIERGIYFKKIMVSSLYDIAVNKLQTIATRTKARDYIDIYYIFKNSEYDRDKYIEKMRKDSRAKFDWPLEAKNLAAAFLKVKDLPEGEFPKMLVPFRRSDMENFFVKAAKKMGEKIFS